MVSSEIAKDKSAHFDSFPDVASSPADHHFAEVVVMNGYIGIDRGITLKQHTLTLAQDQICDSPVLANIGFTTEKFLVQPFIQYV